MKDRPQNVKRKVRFHRWYFCVIGVLAMGILGVEFFLRWHYGLCDAVLMREDSDYEYIAQPNQDRHRFGNTISYNSYSMRSEELRPGSLRILCVGDSVVNGGTLTDQADLATTLLEKRLSATFHQDIQVLNISAGSWGPDNCAAYLKKHGQFGAKAVVLVTSSHDARDNMDFAPVVGCHRSYPNRQYPFAWIELLDRYLCPGIFTNQSKEESFSEMHHITKNGAFFNPGFLELISMCRDNDLFFGVVLHAELNEFIQGRYDEQGQEIISFLNEQKVFYVTDIDIVSAASYRQNDNIHPSAQGQRQLSELLYDMLVPVLQKNLQR